MENKLCSNATGGEPAIELSKKGKSISITDLATRSKEDICVSISDDDFMEIPPKTKWQQTTKVLVKNKEVRRSRDVVNYDVDDMECTHIRVSPKLFSICVRDLDYEKTTWVVDTGFGSILDFNISELSHRLGYKIVESFHHASVTIRLESGNIRIGSDDVHEVLGFPCGTKELSTIEQSDNLVEVWRSQFVGIKGHKITAKMVLEKLNCEKNTNLFFKMNFLVLLTNTFVQSNSNAFINQDILKMVGEIHLQNLAQFDWCSYVINSLMKAKQKWLKDGRHKTFTGPLIFLIILYVDRVKYKNMRTVKRAFPTFLGWDDTLLRNRSNEELNYNSFGRGVITSRKSPTLLDSENDAESRQEEINHFLEFTIEEDNIEKELIFNLETSAADMIKSVNKYNANMIACRAVIGDNTRVKELIEEVCKYVISIIGCTPTRNEMGKDKKTTSEFVSNSREDNISNDSVIGNYDDITRLSVECILPKDTTPFKSLVDMEWGDVCEIAKSYTDKCLDVEMELDKSEVNESMELQQTSKHERGGSVCGNIKEDTKKRKGRLATVLRSPYVSRVIDLKKTSTKEEKNIKNWFLKDVDDDEELLFKCGELILTAKDFDTLRANKEVGRQVVDAWALIMNKQEQYRSPLSPKRFFMPTKMTEKKLANKQKYGGFLKNLKLCWNMYPDEKMQNIDLLFFPVMHGYGNTYLICYNLKNPRWEIIHSPDTVWDNGDTCQQYSNILHGWIMEYLKEIKHPKMESFTSLVQE